VSAADVPRDRVPRDAVARDPVLHPRASDGRPRLAHVDALRAAAVMLVVLAHAGLASTVPGSTGVTVFFTISGFVITDVLLRERRRTGRFDIRSFYWRRLTKLGPPFLVVVLVPTLLWSTTHAVDWPEVGGQVFFVYNWFYTDGSAGAVLPGSSVVWSLAIEEQFYIAFALFWLLAVHSRRVTVPLVWLGAVAVVVAVADRGFLWSQGASSTRILYGTDARLDSIALGVLAAVLADALRTPGVAARTRRWLASNLVVALAVVLLALSALVRASLYQQVLRFSVESVAAALLVLYGVLRTDGRLRGALGRLAANRAVQVVGLASYSVYLAHLVVMHQVEPHLAGWPAGARTAFLVLVGVLAGVLVWRLVEVPVLARRKARATVPDVVPAARLTEAEA